MTAVLENSTARPVKVARPKAVLGVVLLATFLINLDSTIVNVAIPDLSRSLRASTSDLQWVIDAYNLAFAGLILTGGTMGDRFGRRRMLAFGLVVFGAGSAIAATADGVGALIGWRILMGVGAAFVFPATLSLITVTFPERGARAKAIGAWGAATGAAVAFGPIVGGALLAHFTWRSVFVVMVPLAIATGIGAIRLVPVDADIARSHVDLRGLALSGVALTSLVFTVIEAPAHGWVSTRSLLGFLLALLAFSALIAVERTTVEPMLDVRLFTNLRFTAASSAVTFAYFALFGFVFLIILYFQVTRGYSPLGAGVRTLPVAISIGVASGVGTQLAVRIGNKIVVATGLLLVGGGYLWVALAQTTSTSYVIIVAQMICLGGGLGLATAPATEAIVGVLRPEQAGIGSAVNDATRLFGGTLGVAVIGSVYASIYREHIDGSGLPRGISAAATSSYAGTRQIAATLPTATGRQFLSVVDAGFMRGLHAGCGVAAVACALGALVVIAFLPAQPESESPITHR